MEMRFFKISVFSLCALMTNALPAAPSTLFMGTIRFPATLTTIPNIRIYHGGNKIKSEIHKHEILFSILADRQRSSFCLLITKDLAYELKEKNTVQYLKLPSAQPYKFFHVQLQAKEISGLEQQVGYEWAIYEQRLSLKNRIPDDAIIICCDPEYVEAVKGGNAIKLPTIYIKPNILELVGSEHTLHEKSIELLLSSLDHDALHGTIKQELKQDFQQKTILAVTV